VSNGNYRSLPFDSEKQGFLFDKSDKGLEDQFLGNLDVF
jgi:hypothetical protein